MPTAPTAMAGAEVVDDLGTGPPVVLLHGVGFGPETLTPIVAPLSRRNRVLVVRRPEPVPGGVPITAQAAAVATTLRCTVGDEPVTVAGTSGGATVALALAMAEPALVQTVVAHEPLVGRHAPLLFDHVVDSARRLADGALPARAWLRGLVGDAAWDGLGDRDRDEASASGDRLVDDVLPFASWAPSGDDLRSLRDRTVITTVGADSGPARFQAAAALEAKAGAAMVVIRGAGHLVQFDAPELFADVVAAAQWSGATP